MAEVLHHYVEQNTAQTTSSSSYSAISGCTIDGGDLTASTKYLLIFRAKYSTPGSTTNKGYVQVTTADDSDLALRTRSVVESPTVSTNQRNTVFTVQSFTTDSSPADVVPQFKIDGGTTFSIDQISMILIDLDDLGSANYFEATGDSHGEIATTPTVYLSLDGADLGTTEEWLVLGGGRIDSGTTLYSWSMQLRTAYDDSSDSSGGLKIREGEDAAELDTIGFWGRHKAVTSDVDVSLLAWEEDAAANCTLYDTYLIALKTSAFADFNDDFTASGGSVTTETTVATITDYTPTTSGNHLMLGKATKNVGSTRMTLWVEDGVGTEIRTGDSTDSDVVGWDSTKDRLPGFTMQRLSITSETTYNLQQVMSASEDSDFIGLAVLNLNLASGATDATATLTALAATSTFDAATTTNEVNATTITTTLAATGTLDAVTTTGEINATTVLTTLTTTATLDPVTTVNDVNAATTLTALSGPVTFDTVSVTADATATPTVLAATSTLGAVTMTYLNPILRPVGDTAAAGWESAPTGSQDLFAQVDEVAASDTDYIYAENPNP